MFKFYGAKMKLGPMYPPPTHDVIVEPFAGAAGYAVLHRAAARRVILVERDARVAALWRRLLGMSVDELLALPRPRPGDRSDELLVAFASGRTTRDTPESFQVSARMAQRFDPMLRRMAGVLDECRHFEVIEGDFADAPDVEATWFIDPPYQPPASGGRWDRTRGGRYLHSNRDLDYGALGAWSQARRGQLIVCEQEGADWMPWTDSQSARDGHHVPYGEVWHHRP